MEKESSTIPKLEPTKSSVKKNGEVKAFAANTHPGLIHQSTEARVSIVLSVSKPQSRVHEQWPRCSFFGLYSGHGGSGCSDFLRTTLHQLVVRDPLFPSNPREALARGIMTVEGMALNKAKLAGDKSGSGVLVVLVVGDVCYVANVGDSRAILSGDSGSKVFPLNTPHKPSHESERQRIYECGGSIYQPPSPYFAQLPVRVLPGKLAVSRSVGDPEAKVSTMGGNPRVVIAVPDIKAFRVTEGHDFIVMCSDGVVEKIANREIIHIGWSSTGSTIHQACSNAVESLLTTSLQRHALENLTVVFIALSGFKRRIKELSRHRGP